MNFNQLQDLLKYYLYSYKGFSDEDYEILTDSKNPRQFTIDKIKEGFPVEIRMGGTNGRHAMIAYDYDEKADEIFVHPGRLDYPTHVAISSLDYSSFWDATTIVPKKKHACSDNYIYSKEYNRNVHCPCEFDFHPIHHKHSYKSRYEDNPSMNNHKSFCSCGDWTYEPHNFNLVYKGSSGMIRLCSKCKATK